jgi:hypothetical protein
MSRFISAANLSPRPTTTTFWPQSLADKATIDQPPASPAGAIPFLHLFGDIDLLHVLWGDRSM